MLPPLGQPRGFLMMLVIARKPLKNILRWTERVLFAVAIPALAYCIFYLADAWMFQTRASRELDAVAAVEQATPDAPSKSPLVTGASIGEIRIARLGLSVVVIEGVDPQSLRRAAGHIPGTALPGEAGNVAISAHRDTFFRPLRNIQPSDIITLTTRLGEFRYRVVNTKIVNPTDVSVLASGTDQILTLVTCYPFYFVGPAPKRFIVRAERIPSEKTDPGRPLK
jgi:sortase A